MRGQGGRGRSKRRLTYVRRKCGTLCTLFGRNSLNPLPFRAPTSPPPSAQKRKFEKNVYVRHRGCLKLALGDSTRVGSSAPGKGGRGGRRSAEEGLRCKLYYVLTITIVSRRGRDGKNGPRPDYIRDQRGRGGGVGGAGRTIRLGCGLACRDVPHDPSLWGEGSGGVGTGRRIRP